MNPSGNPNHLTSHYRAGTYTPGHARQRVSPALWHSLECLDIPAQEQEETTAYVGWLAQHQAGLSPAGEH